MCPRSWQASGAAAAGPSLCTMQKQTPAVRTKTRTHDSHTGTPHRQTCTPQALHTNPHVYATHVRGYLLRHGSVHGEQGHMIARTPPDSCLETSSAALVTHAPAPCCACWSPTPPTNAALAGHPRPRPMLRLLVAHAPAP
eukprot:361249-Chlamydomonas_euryale.AAC.1